MVYLPDRDHDVFISYAHVDDDPSKWVTSLGKFLAKELRKQLRIKENTGEDIDVEIWKDHKLPRHGDLGDQLEDTLGAASTFLVVMSRSYLLSKWCKREGATFVSGLRDNPNNRIFIVEKEPTDRSKWPDFLKGPDGNPLLSFEFFEEVDIDEFEPMPMTTPYGSIDPRADKLIRNLCKDYSDQLYDLKHNPASSGPAAADACAVYFGFCLGKQAGKDRKAAMDLLSKDKTVRAGPGPDVKLFHQIEKASLAQDLEGCALFVQVLDHNEGQYVVDHELGLVGQQSDQAREAGVPVLYWLSPEVDEEDFEEGAYKQFVDGLRANEGDSPLVTGELADLIKAIQEKLAARPANGHDKQQNRTCFIAVRSDVNDSEMVSKFNQQVMQLPSRYPIKIMRATEMMSAADIDDLMDYAKGIVIVWGKIQFRWVLDEIEKFNNMSGRDRKAGVVALFDPPKGRVFDEADTRLAPIYLTSDSNKSEAVEGISEFVERLETLMDETGDAVH